MADAEQTLAQRLMAGDKRALARAISLVEDDEPEGWALVREVYPHTGGAAVVGFTGPPGVGKSTLIGAFTKLERDRERTVAVLSVDPSSPFTKDVVLLETVGVGQAEVDIIDHADTVVLVLMPGSGDSIQALKAGVMEIPDVIVVNKADHPLTDTMVREIKGVLALGPREGWQVPIVKTEATRGEGVEELARKLAEHHDYIEAEGTLSERRRRNLMNEVLAIATFRMRRDLEASVRENPIVKELLDRVVSRELDPASAAATILESRER
jgi:LAO/AO transport system kinase